MECETLTLTFLLLGIEGSHLVTAWSSVWHLTGNVCMLALWLLQVIEALRIMTELAVLNNSYYNCGMQHGPVALLCRVGKFLVIISCLSVAMCGTCLHDCVWCCLVVSISYHMHGSSTWLPFKHEIAAPISQSPQCSWWGLACIVKNLYFGWLCIKFCLTDSLFIWWWL